MGGRTDVGGNRRFIDTDNVVPTAFDLMVHHRGADDAALADDDNFGAFRKFGHVRELLGVMKVGLFQTQ